MVTGYKDWSHLSQAVNAHAASGGHLTAAQGYCQFKSSEISGSVTTKVSSHHKEQVAKNRKVLCTHVEAILFCAMQEVAFRGHREAFLQEEPSDYLNSGNFLELLNYTRKQNLEYSNLFNQLPKNAKYVHHTIQNEIIAISAGLVRKNILNEVSDSVFAYSIIADETRDHGGVEQLCLAIRYVSGRDVFERFLGFGDLHEFTADKISEGIQILLEKTGLPIDKCVSQAYDGAAVMSGIRGGVNVKIANKVGGYCPYVHCYAHLLNLALQESCEKFTAIRDMLGLLQSIYSFQSKSVVLSEIFDKAQTEAGYDQVLKMPQAAPTRWNSKATITSYFKSRYDSVLIALDVICEVGKTCQIAEAKGYKLQLENFSTLVTVYFMDFILSQTNDLSEYLQCSTLLYMRALSLCHSTILTIQKLAMPSEFEKFWNSASEMAGKMNITIPDKDSDFAEPVTKRKRMASKLLCDFYVDSTTGQRPSTSSGNASRYFKCQKLYFEVIDNIVNVMETRLKSNKDLLETISASDPKSENFLDKSCVVEFCKKFSRFTFDINSMETNAELVKTMLNEAKCLSALECHNHLLEYGSVFGDWLKFFALVLCIPVANATGERSFSTLNRIKTKLRTTMGQQRISDLSILSIERDLTEKLYENPAQVVEVFGNTSHRRIDFTL